MDDAGRLRTVSSPIPGARIQKALTRRGLPLGSVHALLRGAKIAASPGQYLRRRGAGGLRAPAALRVDQARGYGRFGAGALPGADEALARCRMLYEEARGDPASGTIAFVRNPKKDFLLSILSGSDFASHPDLVRFLVSRPLLDAATAYLGEVPILAAANLWWSPENDGLRYSQLFHRDTEDARQLKLFLLVTDTAEDQGPLNFLPADASLRVRARAGRRTSLFADETVEQAGVWERREQLVGPAGSGALVDTSRCLHFGSRGNRRDRLMLAAQFLRFHAPCEATQPFRTPDDVEALDPDPVQRLALGLGC